MRKDSHSCPLWDRKQDTLDLPRFSGIWTPSAIHRESLREGVKVYRLTGLVTQFPINGNAVSYKPTVEVIFSLTVIHIVMWIRTEREEKRIESCMSFKLTWHDS